MWSNVKEEKKITKIQASLIMKFSKRGDPIFNLVDFPSFVEKLKQYT